MRASQQLLAMLLLFNTAVSSAQKQELPPLELLGFIADFSDGNSWMDPENLEGLFNDVKEVENIKEQNDEKQDEYSE